MNCWGPCTILPYLTLHAFSLEPAPARAPLSDLALATVASSLGTRHSSLIHILPLNFHTHNPLLPVKAELLSSPSAADSPIHTFTLLVCLPTIPSLLLCIPPLCAMIAWSW